MFLIKKKIYGDIHTQRKICEVSKRSSFRANDQNCPRKSRGFRDRDLREIALLTIFCAISHYNSFDSCGVMGPQMYEKIIILYKRSFKIIIE
jgi:hypothetical protein